METAPTSQRPAPAAILARRGLRAAAFCCLALAAAILAPASAAVAQTTPRRVVSINACTDQLLFKLASREQIAALSTYAADPGYSIYAAEVRASGIPLIRGTAEEVLKLRPDLVFAGTWNSTATRAYLARQHIPLTELAPDESIAATLKAVEEMARLLGHAERGAALAQQIREAFAAAPAGQGGGGGAPIRALQLQRRGFTSGRQTLTGEVLQRFGLANAADQLGISGTGAAPLEAVLKARPDVLIVLEPPNAADQGAALLLHPTLMAAYPPERRIVLPGRLTVCGGPALIDAAEVLKRGLARLPARR